MKPHLTRDFKVITLAGGCFWGVEEYYRRLKGIVNTAVGFAQGHTENPSYKAVCTGQTGHTEAVLITYNPSVLRFEAILDHFFRIIDPTQMNQQGNDIGTQYRTGIYVHSEDELEFVKNYVQQQQANYAQPIVVETELLNNFFPAEDEHQLYLYKNPHGYCHVDFSLIKEDELK